MKAGMSHSQHAHTDDDPSMAATPADALSARAARAIPVRYTRRSCATRPAVARSAAWH
jgi:hypothetical protein